MHYWYICTAFEEGWSEQPAFYVPCYAGHITFILVPAILFLKIGIFQIRFLKVEI